MDFRRKKLTLSHKDYNQIFFNMSEENVKNPMDLNGDGKVTLAERVQYAAGKAGEKIDQAMDQIKADAKVTAADAKVFAAKAGEKAKEFAAKAGDKAKEFAAKAGDKAKVVYAEAKEDVAEAAEKAKAKIDEWKEKKES